MSASNPGLEPESNETPKEQRAEQEEALRPSKPDVQIVHSPRSHTGNGEHVLSRSGSEPQQQRKNRTGLSIRTAEPNASKNALAVRAGDLSVIPTSDQVLGLVKSLDGDVAAMKDMHRRARAWVAAGEELDAPRDRLLAACALKIELEREIGTYLLQTDHRGGLGSKSSSTTSIRGGSSNGLPAGINKHEARLYRRMARIPGEVKDAYLKQQETHGELPSSTGLVGFATAAGCCCDATPKRARQPVKSRRSVRQRSTGSRHAEAAIDFTDIWDALRTFTPFNVAIGLPAGAVNADLELRPDVADRRKVQGNVVAWISERVDEWLAGLHEAKAKGDVTTAVVVFSATTHEPWFRLVDEGGWMCCFLTGQGATEATIVACCGARQPEFARKLAPFGAILIGTRYHRK